MNEVQAKVFELVKIFDNVCKELNIQYFFINGSALGAYKYKGFIPWDDDVDIGLFRKDYEKFLAEAQRILPEDIFVQNYRTDKNFPFRYSKLRNSSTTFLEENVKNISMNHGIYIDIFPLDSCDNGQSKPTLTQRWLIAQSFCNLSNSKSKKIKLRDFVLRNLGFGRNTDKALKKYEQLISNSSPKSEYINNYGDRQSKGLVPRDWYGEGKKAMFEGIEVMVPEKIDEYLTHKYGDWRSDPPKEQQYSHHTAIICDIEKSYKDYIPIKK